MPALLTRRDELFPLARQVVRDSGYQYSKGHSRYGYVTNKCLNTNPHHPYSKWKTNWVLIIDPFYKKVGFFIN